MEKIPQKERNRLYYLFALRIVGDFGATIAIPVVILVIIGQKMDVAYHTNFLFTTIGFVVAALISGRIIFRKAKLYGKEYENLNKKLS
jgi:hypothetical protein